MPKLPSNNLLPAVVCANRTCAGRRIVVNPPMSSCNLGRVLDSTVVLLLNPVTFWDSFFPWSFTRSGNAAAKGG